MPIVWGLYAIALCSVPPAEVSPPQNIVAVGTALLVFPGLWGPSHHQEGQHRTGSSTRVEEAEELGRRSSYRPLKKAT